MSFFSRLADARARRRSSATFDSRGRRVVRAIERRIRFLLSSPLGVLLHPREVRRPVPLDQVNRVLILRYDALGDAVLSSAVWHALKKYAPHIRIGVVGSRRNRTLLQADPAIDDVFVFSKALTWHVIPDLFRARRAAKWDMVLNISFHDKTRAAIYSRIVAPHAITVTAVWDHREKYERLYSIVGQRPANTPIVLQWLAILKDAFGLELTQEDTLPTIFADPGIERSFAPEIDAITNRAGKKEYVIINTDAAQSFREWGLPHALELSQEIRSRWPELHIFWTSAPLHSGTVQSFLKSNQSEGIAYLLTPSVHHLLVAIKGARVVLSPDTSVVHIAAAYRKPTVGLYVEHKEYPIRGTISRMVFAPDHTTAASIPVEPGLTALGEVMQESTR
ncbi:MAG: glycosyltransferase family 9 protein [Bacteroidota bacterium]|nr:glycosyltransferase family 9 protein [Bacteroidota bacterium]